MSSPVDKAISEAYNMVALLTVERCIDLVNTCANEKKVILRALETFKDKLEAENA